jgi:Fe-S cluster biogenesis protein NfuA
MEITMLKEDVQKAINDVRPSLQADGGDIELIDVSNDGKVQVKLKGACHGCPMAQVTLRQGVEKHIKTKVPAVLSVEAV